MKNALNMHRECHSTASFSHTPTGRLRAMSVNNVAEHLCYDWIPVDMAVYQKSSSSSTNGFGVVIVVSDVEVVFARSSTLLFLIPSAAP